MTTLTVVGIELRTDAFDDLDFESCEIVSHRILSLEYVESINWLNGCISVNCPDDDTEPMLAHLEAHLEAPVADGERVQENFHEYGRNVYTYTYHPGSYPITQLGPEILAATP